MRAFTSITNGSSADGQTRATSHPGTTEGVKRRIVLATGIAGVGAALAAYAGAFPGGSGSASGVYGRVVLGPPCPVSLEAPTCKERPLRAEIAVVRVASGRRVATLRSGDDGRFRRALAPGSYRLEPQPVGRASGARKTIRVHALRYTQVTLRYRT